MRNSIICPTCDEICRLSSDLNDFYITKISKRVEVNFLSYECDSCEMSFTTDEIDEENLSRVSKAWRNYRRKIKIEKIV